MSAASILIVTNGPMARNPRVFKEATVLGDAGHAVTVLTPRNHPPSEPIDAALSDGAPFRRVPIDLLPGYGTPRWKIFFRLLRHRLGRQAMTRLRWPNLHALGPAAVLLRAARAHSADLTIVHNEVPHGIGARLLNDGRRVAADIEDWHSEDLLPQDRLVRPLGLLRDVERRLLHDAVYTTTTSHALANALHVRYGGTRPHVISNSFPLQAALPARSAADAPPAFFWFSQTIGPGRGLEHFFSAWALTRRPSRLVLLGEKRPGYDQTVLELLPPRLRAHVTFLPLVSPAALPAVIARHDIGLALEQSFIVNRDLTITNKIIQYLNAGLAIVASDTTGQREVLAHDPSAGVIVDTHETTAFAAALDTLLADRAALAARQQAARRLAETVYNWELEAPRLCALVADALSRPRNLPA